MGEVKSSSTYIHPVGTVVIFVTQTCSCSLSLLCMGEHGTQHSPQSAWDSPGWVTLNT